MQASVGLLDINFVHQYPFVRVVKAQVMDHVEHSLECPAKGDVGDIVFITSLVHRETQFFIVGLIVADSLFRDRFAFFVYRPLML